jgi:hypothetical protein
MTEEQRLKLFGPTLYARIKREAEEWAKDSAPLTQEEKDRIKILFATAPAHRRSAA